MFLFSILYIKLYYYNILYNNKILVYDTFYLNYSLNYMIIWKKY